MPRRSKYCGEFREEHVGQECCVMGWVHSYRDHGGIIFIDLRDRTGLVQIVADPSNDPDAHAKAERVRSEWVVAAVGRVRPRSEETINPKLDTGQVEIITDRIEILTEAETPPFPVDAAEEMDESLRLKWRFIDLRRPQMLERLRKRHEVVLSARNYLSEQGFWEIETPMLINSSPEGARDFLVPSRMAPGHFYALPQSPQLLKQTLMASGVDRYFQMARCLRDEDLRADRQPEHTQIDIEMSFATQEQVLETVEGLIRHIYQEAKGIELPEPFPRMTYAEAMLTYGSDKPDLRFGLEIQEVTDVVAKSDFRVFTETIDKGGRVRAINVKGGAKFSRSQLDNLQPKARELGGKGAAYIIYEPDGTWRSPLLKYFPEEVLEELRETLGGEPGDLFVFGADDAKALAPFLGRLRLHLAELAGLPGETDAVKPLWVVDFPVFEQDEETGNWQPMHHAFTMPRPDCLDTMEDDPGAVIGQLYDLVVNGAELGSGSIRIHDPAIQQRVFKIVGIDEEEADRKFSYLLRAFRYGAPPHGGIALGIDRLIMQLVGAKSIREVIAFPKTATGADLLMDAPGPVDEAQLEELHIRVVE
ncbi:MAG: aspartate--tRNA ligase [Armatimonadia bacterium]|nr:aspartate--tRNA ligase [Armatimonadia bacterium]